MWHRCQSWYGTIQSCRGYTMVYLPPNDSSMRLRLPEQALPESIVDECASQQLWISHQDRLPTLITELLRWEQADCNAHHPSTAVAHLHIQETNPFTTYSHSNAFWPTLTLASTRNTKCIQMWFWTNPPLLEPPSLLSPICWCQHLQSDRWMHRNAVFLGLPSSFEACCRLSSSNGRIGK